MADRDLTPAEAASEVEDFLGSGWKISTGTLHSHDITVWRGRVMIDSLSANSWRESVDALKAAWRDAVRPWVVKAGNAWDMDMTDEWNAREVLGGDL